MTWKSLNLEKDMIFLIQPNVMAVDETITNQLAIMCRLSCTLAILVLRYWKDERREDMAMALRDGTSAAVTEHALGVLKQIYHAF